MKIKNFRWWIVGLIALATAINYLDRQNFPVVYSEIIKTIPISDSQFGLLSSLFLLAYGIMYAVGGRIVDKLGTRTGYTIIVIWWSLANISHAFISGIFGLGIARFLLGAGEGGGFPASAKAVSEWFPAKERSFAFGIFNTGSSLGAVLAPPLIFLIVDGFGSWQWTFVLFGAAGLIWVVIWLIMYRTTSKSKLVTKEEKEYIEESHRKEREEESKNKTEKIPWLSLFKIRKIWGLLIIKFLSDSAWFFFIFWLPKYLSDVRGLDIKGIGAYAWIPYAFAGVGSFFGGWLSSYLIKKGISLDKSRKISLGIAAAMLPASLFITVTPSIMLSLLFFGIAMFGHQFWSTIVQTLAADLFPSKVVGSVAGLMGSFGTFGAMLFSLVIGFVIQNIGYTPVFIVSGILHPISFILVFVFIKKIEQVPELSLR